MREYDVIHGSTVETLIGNESMNDRMCSVFGGVY